MARSSGLSLCVAAILGFFLGSAVVQPCVSVTFAGEGSPVENEPLQIAVAANFKTCLEEIRAAYSEQGGSPVVLIVGSTGRHFAQIRAGAPFDLFFAADQERPRLLEESSHTVAGTRFTYAIGRLVLWAPAVDIPVEGDLRAILSAGEFHHLAIANPRLAPYGRAARQTLESLGLWEKLADRLVTGQSVGQAWQFVASGAAEAGLLAGSQAAVLGESGRGGAATPADVLSIPEDHHDPIIQQAVVLDRARDNPEAGAFLDFVRTPAARAIIRAHGYRVPESNAP